MIRTQISVDAETYERAKEAARRRGISLAELVRRGLAEVLSRERVDRPWMAFAGSLEGEPADSESVDEVVYRRAEA
jgi:hypothetical protein